MDYLRNRPTLLALLTTSLVLAAAPTIAASICWAIGI